jgi:hypothetical protein
MKNYKVTIQLRKSTGMEIKEVEFGGKTNGEVIADAFQIAWSFQDIPDIKECSILKVEETGETSENED